MTNVENIESVTNPAYIPWLIDIAKGSALISNYCDHCEHAETSKASWGIECGDILQDVAVQIGRHEKVDLHTLYAERLERVEHRNLFWESPEAPNGRELVLSASDWRGLQNAQITHNIYYNPDVTYMSRMNQMRHYAFHVAKLTGAVANQVESGPTEEFISTRLPDMLIFRVLIATTMSQKLPEDPLDLQFAI